MSQLSVIIVAMNEAHDIAGCLESVQGWADEIIVFDSGSTDGTQDICRRYAVRLFETDWPGDGPQKNRALDQARGDWVLCLDADERVSPELRGQIARVLRDDTPHAAFSMPRSSSFCGQFMRHGGWWPDRITRLFRRERGRFTEPRTHAALVVDGSVGALDGPIIHLSVTDLHEVLDKLNVYSTEGARAMFGEGRRSSPAKALGKGFWAFVRTYLLRAGFLDGRLGLVLALANAHGTYYRYMKLWLLQRGVGARS